MKKIKSEKLENVAQILPGFAFKSALQHDERGNTYVLQAKDVRGCLYVVPEKLQCMFIDDERKQILQYGDVVLSGRGFFEAAVFLSDVRTIATAALYILRPDVTRITPEYLAIYLNSIKGQMQLQKRETTTTIKAILMRDVREIAIPMRSVEEQCCIVDLYRNIERQKNLMEKKMCLQQQIMSKVI